MSKNDQLPITDAEADFALGALARFDHVVLAVSGGPDSMALMVLAGEWLSRAPAHRPAVSVVTVDHGLRAESRSEAEMVGVQAQRMGLPHTILDWIGDKPQTGLPMAAREARYRLIEDRARTIGAGTIAIVTAHHRDDQAETFAMRLARGAGIDGLSGMRAERPLLDGSPIVLARPLLGIPKSRLVATLEARGISYAEDPTNDDPRYERTRIRSRLTELAETGLTPEVLATSARRLGDAREGLAYAEGHFVASLGLSFGNEVFATLDRQAFEAGPAVLRQRVVSRLIRRYGGASPAPRLSEIEDLVARMQREAGSRATLGGVMISSGPRFIRVWREAGRLDASEFELKPGKELLWDQRFLLKWSGASEDSVIVKPLGETGFAAIVTRLDPARRPPSRAALGLPAFWARETLLAAPSLAPFALLNTPPLDPAGCELNPLAASVTF